MLAGPVGRRRSPAGSVLFMRGLNSSPFDYVVFDDQNKMGGYQYLFPNGGLATPGTYGTIRDDSKYRNIDSLRCP